MNKRQEAKAKTRIRLLHAAGRLFEAYGYEEATIRDIASEAGMSTGAIFANWEGKAQLYREIYGHLPVTAAHGREMLETLAGFARNARELSTHEPFEGALGRLLDRVRSHIAEVGLVIDGDTMRAAA